MSFESWKREIEPTGFEAWKTKSEQPELTGFEKWKAESADPLIAVAEPRKQPSAIAQVGQYYKEALAAPARTIESMAGSIGGLIRMGAEKLSIEKMTARGVALIGRFTGKVPGDAVIVEHLLRKYGITKADSFYERKIKKLADAGKKISDFWNEQANKGWEAPNPDIVEARWSERPLSKGVSAVYSGLTSIGVVLGTTYLTKSPQAGLAILAASETGSMYSRLRDEDVAPDVASKLAQLAGAWTFVTEKIGFKKLLAPTKRTILNHLKKAGWEGLQEVVEGMGHNLLEYFGYNYRKPSDIPTAIKAAFDHMMDGWLDALVGGFGAGGMVSVALPGARPAEPTKPVKKKDLLQIEFTPVKDPYGGFSFGRTISSLPSIEEGKVRLYRADSETMRTVTVPEDIERFGQEDYGSGGWFTTDLSYAFNFYEGVYGKKAPDRKIFYMDVSKIVADKHFEGNIEGTKDEYFFPELRIPGNPIITPPTIEEVTGKTMEEIEQGMPEVVEAAPEVQRKPYKSQFIAGHEIPEILKMDETERRKFMEKATGETSMAKMTPSTAQDYISALHELARRKGIEVGVLPSERIFKKPIIGLTPQLYKAKILGVKFMINPAAIGKQKLDLEFAKEAQQIDKMERIINRLGKETLKTKADAKLKNKPTKSIARFTELLNENEEAPAGLSKEEKNIFDYFRNLSRSIITRENEVREELGMELIEYRPGYIRHIVDTLVLDIIEGRHPIPEEIKYWAEKHASKKITNPMEFQRKLGDELEGMFSNDLIKVTKAMMWTGLKEIHLNKPLKFFENQMGLHSEVIPDSTRRWTEKFINHMIIGKQTAVDQRLNELVKESGIGGIINKILKPFGRKISHKPLTNLMAKAGRLQIYGVMGWRPKQLLRNKFQLLQNLALYTTKANLKSFLPANKQLKELMSESLFLKTYKGFEDLVDVDKRILGRLWLAPFQWTAVSNARRAMKVAYYDTMELIENSKYKNLGWANSERTYTEAKDFLYPNEKEKLLNEMEFGAGVTQYHYIPMAMPGVFNYKIATPLTRLQSWWMNYFFKFHREAAHRFFKGETREGLKLPWSRRIGWGRYLIIGGVVLNTLGYTSSFLFGAAPEAVPPLAQLLISLYKYIVTDDERTRKTAKRNFLYALKTFIPGYLAKKDIEILFDDEVKLRKLIFYNKGIFAEEKGTPYVRKR